MLIVEGPDLVGNTTFAKILVSRLNETPQLRGRWMYSRLGLLPEGWDYLLDYIERADRFTVQDRYWLSEMAIGNKARISRDMLPFITARLTMLGAYTVLITATPDALRLLWDSSEREEHFTLSEILTANAEFRHWVNKVDLHYELSCSDTLPSSNESLIENIVTSYIKRQRALDAFLSIERNGRMARG